MPDPLTTPRLLGALHQRGIASARELMADLDVSQPTVSRALRAAGPHVARIGRARHTRYAATRDVRGLGTHWPLYRVDARGQAHEFGRLTALDGGGCLVASAPSPDWLRGEFAEGLFPGLPWFVDDMRPQGFLGRQFVHRYADQLGLPDDLVRWNEDAVLVALLLRGHDGPGNFVLGDAALQHALAAKPEAIPAAMRGRDYADLARATLAGERAGSSAAGEQPKFTACVAPGDGTQRHVIVKFSEAVDNHPGARRWADLLLCEHHAAELLSAHGHASASTELIWSHGRLCLESTRFDRIGTWGRRGIVTLAAWSDAHDGIRDNWAAAAARMHRAGWLSADALEQVRLRWWFGRLIGNTDMHFGNLAFHLDDTMPLELAPGYDMLPMRYRPSASGVMYQQALEPPPPLPADRDPWRRATRLAQRYWEELAGLGEVSMDFRHLADANAAAITATRRRFG